MAKRKARTSAVRQQYMKERRRIQNFLRSVEKRGYIGTEGILPDIPKTVTKASVNRLNKLKADEIYKKLKYIDRETGVIYSGARGRDIERAKAAKKGAETRRRNKKAEEEFWTWTDENGKRKETGGSIREEPGADVVDGGEVIFDNLVDDLIRRLSQPIEQTYTSYFYGTKRRRQKDIVERIQKRAKELIAIIDAAVALEGKSKIGWRLQDHATDVERFLNGLLYASEEYGVEVSFVALMRIIKGRDLTPEEREASETVSETFEDW